MQNRYRNLFPATLVFSGGLMLLGFVLESPTDILWGLYHIVTMQDLLITDYVVIGGPGAALINAGLVTAISICIIKISGDPFNGFTIVEMGLMAGFSLFGKNFLNIWPIILGTWLYAKYQREPFSKHASVALLATSLAPLVSYMALGSIHASLPLGVATGVCIGFILPSLSAYTYKIQNGMNLYNMGFACGLFAMMIVPVLTAFGDSPDSVLYWATEYNNGFILVLTLLCSSLIFLGLFCTGVPFLQVNCYCLSSSVTPPLSAQRFWNQNRSWICRPGAPLRTRCRWSQGRHSSAHLRNTRPLSLPRPHRSGKPDPGQAPEGAALCKAD